MKSKTTDEIIDELSLSVKFLQEENQRLQAEIKRLEDKQTNAKPQTNRWNATYEAFGSY